MIKKICAIAAAILIAMAVSADELQLNPDHPGQYTVQKGDTLWDIAGRFLVKPWLWPQIWQANPQVQNPNLIYPGDTLTLVYKDGQPTLELSRGERHLGGRNFKKSPVAREHLHDDAIQTIPLDTIRPFLTRPLVVEQVQMEKAHYVVSSEDQHLITGADDRIYVRGIDEGMGTRFTIFRPGGAYKSGDQVLGYEALDVGDAVLERTGDPAILNLVRSSREVLNGDRLLPEAQESFPEFIPHAPAADVAGNIISAIDGVAEVGRHQIVVVDLGAEDGIEPGHVLGIFQSGLTARDDIKSKIKEKEEAERQLKFARSDTSPVDSMLEHIFNDVRNTKKLIDKKLGVRMFTADELVTLPEERAGDLMVFRTFDKVSYALVMATFRPVRMNDAVRNP